MNEAAKIQKREYGKLFYLRNRARILERQKRTNLLNRDARLRYAKAYREKNKERIRAGIYDWRARNLSRAIDYQHKWELEHRDRRCLYAKRYRKRHPENVIKHNAIRRSRMPIEPEAHSLVSKFVRSLRKKGDILCNYCGAVITKLHVDHVVPLARGGKHVLENLAASCSDCNLSKGAKLISEWKCQSNEQPSATE